MSTLGLNPNISTSTERDEYVISVSDLLRIIWRRLWVILLVTALLTAVAVGLDLLRTPTYEATIKILVGQQLTSEATSDLGNDVYGLQQLTQSVAVAVPTRPVAEAVIDELDLGMSSRELLKNLTVEQVDETTFLEVSFVDKSPREAKQIADTVGAVFSEQVAEVSPSANSITATVWEKAAIPDSPTSPNLLRDALLALVLGLMLGAGFAFLLEQLDDRWRSPEETEQISGVPNFGVIPVFNIPKDKKGGG